MKGKMNIANIITLSRILFAVPVLFSTAFSARFYVFYLLGAFTDMVDGTVARKLNLKSPFGAKLDSAADFIFVAAVFASVCRAVYLPAWVWAWAAVIALIKIINLLSGLFMYHRVVSAHTVMNKAAGALLFLLPFGIDLWQGAEILLITAGLAATFAAVQEGHYIRTGKETE